MPPVDVACEEIEEIADRLPRPCFNFREDSSRNDPTNTSCIDAEYSSHPTASALMEDTEGCERDDHKQS